MNPQRINQIVSILGQIWSGRPDKTLGQVICEALGTLGTVPPFSLEYRLRKMSDEEFINSLIEYYNPVFTNKV